MKTNRFGFPIGNNQSKTANQESKIPMIIPTPEFDPLYAKDGIPFRTKMIQYIEQEFSDLLGDRRQLVHSQRGLETPSNIVTRQLRSDLSTKAA